MLAYISNLGLNLYRNATFAPLWHALVTPDNALWLNAAAAVVAALCFAYAIPQLAFRDADTKVRWSPWFVFLAFFAVPPFLRHLFDLSPVMFALLPIALSLAALAAQGWSDIRKFVKGGEDVRLGRFGGWFVVSGALAALAAWEGWLGLAFAPLLLAATLLPSAHGPRRVFDVVIAWFAGFALVFAAEGLFLGFPWLAFKVSLLPLAGLAVFFLLAIVPVLVMRRFGENPWVFLGWGVVLLVFAVIAAQVVVGTTESACERFVKVVFADLGERKLVVSDGLFDGYLDLLKPEGVRVVGTRTNEDREFLLNSFDDGAALTNRAVLVRSYYGRPEAEAAFAELGFMRRVPSKSEKSRAEREAARRRASAGTNVVVTLEQAKSNMVSRLQQEAAPLFKELTDVEAELAKPVSEQDRALLERGRMAIRQTWRRGVFRGARLSNALLTADLMLGDVAALESDAITALMIDRNDPAANGVLGSIRQEQGKYEQAERYLRKGVKGEGAFAMGKLAILLVQTDRPAEAVEWARKAVAKAQGSIPLREPLVAGLIESGAFGEAERELAEVWKLAAAQRASEKECPDVQRFCLRLADCVRKRDGEAAAKAVQDRIDAARQKAFRESAREESGEKSSGDHYLNLSFDK